MTKGAPNTEQERRRQFRIARLAELDERIRQKDYADDLHTRNYRILNERFDAHHRTDTLAANRLVGKAATQKTKRLLRARISTSIDLELFEHRLVEVKPGEQNIDYLAELKNRRDRQNIDNRRRQKRLEKIICDRDQEALLREKRERWSALDVILKRKPSKEAEVDSELERIAITIRKAVLNRQYHEQELRRIQARASAAALNRDLTHQLANHAIYEQDVNSCLQRIRECDNVTQRRSRIQLGQECKSLLIDLIATSVDIACYKQANPFNEVDTFVLDQWKAAVLYRFVHRAPEESRVQGRIDVAKFTYDLTVSSELEQHLNRRAMRQYLWGLASWWNPTEPLESETGSELLGASLDRIICAAVSPSIPQPTSAIRCPVVCVIGKPFAGKSSLCKQLGEQLDCLVIDINVYAQEPGVMGVNDTDYIMYIERVAASQSDIKGIILDGFPSTRSQAQLLQRHLSGNIIPEVQADGLASRYGRSDLVPYPDGVPYIPMPPFKGSKITTILDVDINDETSARRCLCRRFDPVSDESYSMEKLLPFDMPMKERLVHLPNSELIRSTLPETISTWNAEHQAMVQFFNLFSILSVLNGRDQAHDVVAQAISYMKPKEAGKEQIVVQQNPGNVPALEEPDDIRSDYLDEEVISRLHGLWVTVETVYISHIERSLRDEISSYIPAINYYNSVINNYQQFIERYDDRQTSIDKATTEYNEIDNVIRTEDIVKAELHQRAQILDTTLSAIMEAKHKENAAEFKRLEQSEWFQKQLLACFERCVSLIQAEISRHQSMVVFFGDIESCQGAKAPSESLIIPARADLTTQASVESTVQSGKKGATSSTNPKQEPLQNTPLDNSFLDLNGKYSASRACEFLQLAAKNACDLATVKDAHSDKPLVRYERILTRNRIKRILCFGTAAFNKIRNNANKLMDLLKETTISRERSEIQCCSDLTMYFKKKIEEEVPMLHPIRIVNGISLVVNESETIYDSEKDVIPSLFDQNLLSTVPLY